MKDLHQTILFIFFISFALFVTFYAAKDGIRKCSNSSDFRSCVNI